MELVLIGVNHRTAPIAFREQLALGDDERPLLQRGLADGAWREVFVLSTCNRTEIYACADAASDAEAFVRGAVAELRGADLLGPGPHRYRRTGLDAARHLIRVACGLDSLIVGEIQILGQVKEALACAREAGTSGPHLDRLLTAAIRAGKRARSETAISQGAISVASAAVALAREAVGGFRGRRALVIGAGETGRLVALHLALKHPAELTITNRSAERATALAAEAGGRALPFERILTGLAEADVAVVAVRAARPILTAAEVEAARASRPGAPLVIVDVSVPRAVDPAAGRLPGVRLLAIDALTATVERSLAQRQGEIAQVEAIVEQECERFAAWQRSLPAAPLVRELRDHFERVRSEEVQRHLKHFAEAERERVERLTRALVNKLLHLPTMRLREADPDSGAGRARLDAARELFALDAGLAADSHEVERVD